ncbi:MAG: Holliday junction resolvase RuvX [Candidatus Shikimatogenerans sp. JK-2022]|nr:Holliday junction resolvase RuvX [Candidatus Shikimatogenerans bostrichidophilus]
MLNNNRVLGIDYGLIRSGISITDPNQNYAIGLSCIKTKKIINYLKKIIKEQKITIIVIGLPKKMNNKNQRLTYKVFIFKKKILKIFPNLIIDFIDERYTSKISRYYLNIIKYPKSKIKDEVNIMSAILILQSYLKIKKL